MPAKISATLIIRDEEKTLEACLQSVRPHVDELIVVDTGSVDSSPAIAKKYATKFQVWTGCNNAEGQIEDFSAARNHALSLASHDWIFWCDGDDEVSGGEHLHEMADSVPEQFVNANFLAPYLYDFDDKGHLITLHHRERLVRSRENLKWIFPVHEVLSFKDGTATGENTITIPDQRIVVKHLAKSSGKVKDPQRNLRILHKYIQAHKETDIRALYYYGNELRGNGMVGDAIRTFRRYIQLSKWDDEKCLATLALAGCYQTVGDHELAIEWAFKAMQVKSWAEPYWLIARSYYDLASKGETELWDKVAHFAQVGLNLGGANTVLFSNPTEQFEIYKILCTTFAIQKKFSEALEYGKKALEKFPDDTQLIRNIRAIELEILGRRMLVDLKRVEELGALKFGAATDVVTILQGGVPSVPVVTPGKLDLAFFVGQGLQDWTPLTLAQTGMGGSETMAWAMASRLRKLGHKVRVYAQCQPFQEGTYEGVEWYNFDKFENITCDVLIASRRPDAVFAPGFNAKRSILWVHDVNVGQNLMNPFMAAKFDRILGLSEWHLGAIRASYPRIHPSKIQKTRNGIDLSRFEAKEVYRNPHRAIYSSSPDRGLFSLVELWPRVQQAVENAELHIYYGFEGWETVATQTNNANDLEMIKLLKAMIEGNPSIHNHGRVNQAELAHAFMISGVWTYPTWFTETSCITGMEALTSGCRIVTSPIAALPETLGPNAAMIPGDWRSEDYQTLFATSVIEAMTRETGDDRALNKEFAQRYDLDSLAKEWDTMLHQLVDDPSQPFYDVNYNVDPTTGAVAVVQRVL